MLQKLTFHKGKNKIICCMKISYHSIISGLQAPLLVCLMLFTIINLCTVHNSTSAQPFVRISQARHLRLNSLESFSQTAQPKMEAKGKYDTLFPEKALTALALLHHMEKDLACGKGAAFVSETGLLLPPANLSTFSQMICQSMCRC